MNDKISFIRLLKAKDSDTVLYVIGIGVAALTAITYLIMHFLNWPSFCVINRYTGAYCPGCGGTRAIVALFTGHILDSIIYNPFVPYFAVIAGIFYVSQTLRYLTHGKVRGWHFRDVFLYIGIGILVINCIVKNILHFTGVWHM